MGETTWVTSVVRRGRGVEMDQKSDKRTGAEGWRQGQSLGKPTPAHSPSSSHGRSHTAWPWKPQLQGGGTYLASPHLSGTEGLVSVRPLGPISSPSVLVILLGLSLPRYSWGRLSQIPPSSWAAWGVSPVALTGVAHPPIPQMLAGASGSGPAQSSRSRCQPCPSSAQRDRPLGPEGDLFLDVAPCLPRGLSSY